MKSKRPVITSSIALVSVIICSIYTSQSNDIVNVLASIYLLAFTVALFVRWMEGRL